MICKHNIGKFRRGKDGPWCCLACEAVVSDDDDYQPRDDFARSIADCYQAIKDRMAKGGPGWGQ